MHYRKEIDGLRAIAVSAVLIFHFFPTVFPYGYLGVDLFFVISGFLISLYILDESNKGTFSFVTFYQRRIKRILPATITVSTVALLGSFFIVIGVDFENFLKSLIATLTVTANIFFWLTGGYFGSNDALKPLLHMWSLGVEEQFYLFFPVVFIIVLTYVKSPIKRLSVVSVIVLLGFCANYYLINRSGGNPAFFLMPFRIWQFGLGVIAALFYRYYAGQHRPLDIIFALSLMLLGFSLAPKFIVIGFLVTIATAYFLAKNYTPVRGIDLFFDNKIVRHIGLISFSLYLWHWPIVVFIRYVTIDNPSVWIMAFGLILTYVLSYISYRFIEQPFRRTIPLSVTFKILAISVISLIGFSVFYLKTDFFKEPDNRATIFSRAIQTNYRCAISDYIAYGGSRACIINKDLNEPYDIALVGNSHAQMYVPALENKLKEHNKKALLIPLNGCLPTTDININEKCLELAQLNYASYQADNKIKTVIIALTWHTVELVTVQGEKINDGNHEVLVKSLLNLIDLIQKTGKEVFLVGPIQIPDYDVSSVLSRQIKFNSYSDTEITQALRISRESFDNDYQSSIELLKSKLGNHFVIPSQFLCDTQHCYFGDEKGVYFSDNNHLGRYGITKMHDLFTPVFE